MPPNETGTPAHHHRTASRALFVVHKTRRPVAFITMTTPHDCLEIQTRLACFPKDDHGAAEGQPEERLQDRFDRPALLCDAFEGKRRALEAGLRSGTAFRNLGRPQYDGDVQVPAASGKGSTTVPNYKFPLEKRGGGLLVGSRENQRNGSEHMHYVWAPRDVPHQWTMAVDEGMPLKWVDGLTCARLTDRTVLEQFKMLLPRAEARALPGVARRRGAAHVHPAYAYLDDTTHAMVVHPDLVHDGGERYQNANYLLRDLILLICGQGSGLVGCRVKVEGDPAVADGATGLVTAVHAPALAAGFDDVRDCADAMQCEQAGGMYFDVQLDGAGVVTLARVNLVWIEGGAAATHYSLAPFSKQHKPKGLMIHQHPRGPEIHEPYCNKHESATDCGSYYPRPVSARSEMGADGFIHYQRGTCDVMVVPHNPWLMFYHRTHLNVEAVCSGVRTVLYLFKLLSYIYKVHETNKAQIAEDGQPIQGEQGDQQERTHERHVPHDQVNDWFSVLETCSAYALRGHHARPLFVMEPCPADVRCARAATPACVRTRPLCVTSNSHARRPRRTALHLVSGCTSRATRTPSRLRRPSRASATGRSTWPAPSSPNSTT